MDKEEPDGERDCGRQNDREMGKGTSVAGTDDADGRSVLDKSKLSFI